MDSQQQMPSIPSYKRSCLGKGMNLQEQAISEKILAPTKELLRQLMLPVLGVITKKPVNEH